MMYNLACNKFVPGFVAVYQTKINQTTFGQKPSVSGAPDTLHQPPSALLFLEYVSKRWGVATKHKSRYNVNL